MTDAELPWMLESPTKVTVIPVEPSGNAEVVSVALPFFSCTVPKTVFPAVNVTGPVGFAVGDEIVAINMTDWPIDDGFGEEVRVAELVACSTV